MFTYTPTALKPTAELIQNFEALLQGDVLAPAEIEQKLAKRFRLLGPQGLVGIALAAIDMALWDALARVHSMPLVRLLGGVEKPVRAYGAVGYDGVQESGKAAESWAKRGFTGVKAKIGYPTVQEDVAVVRAIRKAAGDDMAIMVDYNQCLTPTEAVERLRVLDDEGLTWLFDPGETLVVENPNTVYGLCRSEALVVVHHDGHVVARCLSNGAHNGDILLHSGVANLGFDTLFLKIRCNISCRIVPIFFLKDLMLSIIYNDQKLALDMGLQLREFMILQSQKQM